MNTKLLTGLAVATAAIAGLFSNTASASAATLSASDSVWNESQRTIFNPTSSLGQLDYSIYQKYVQKESVAIPNSGQFKLDPAKLELAFDHNVNIFFVNEGAGYRNQLAFTSTGSTNSKGLLFKDISCTGKGCVGDWGGNALKLGDGVNIGNITAGSQLDFFLRADGLNRGTKSNVFGTKTEYNADGLQHVVAYAIGTRHLLLGFEDLYGGYKATGIDQKTGIKNENSDRDFNDTVFVVDVGEANVRCLTKNECKKAPEPTAVLSLMGLGVAGLVMRRRQNEAG
jgi:hypothetical protein